MGQDQSVEAEYQDTISVKQEKPQKVKCPHCEDQIATYRCKILSENSSTVMKETDLIDFWDMRIREEQGEYIIVYLACNKCIIPEVKPYFTHHKKGWWDKIFVEDTYELIKRGN